MPKPKGCLTTGEAAKLADTSRELVKYWIAQGFFPAARDPKNGWWYIRKTDFTRWLKKKRAGSKKLEFKMQKKGGGKRQKASK